MPGNKTETENGLKVVDCQPINRNEIPMDPSGFYFLIRIDFRQGFIECAACHPDVKNERFALDGEPGEGGSQSYHVETIFRGRAAQDIYHRILLEKKYVAYTTHAAYLGKELKKAELALALGIDRYYQE